jgi:hypothetical protein
MATNKKVFCPLQDHHVGLLKAQSKIVRVSVSTQKINSKNGNKGK